MVAEAVAHAHVVPHERPEPRLLDLLLAPVRRAHDRDVKDAVLFGIVAVAVQVLFDDLVGHDRLVRLLERMHDFAQYRADDDRARDHKPRLNRMLRLDRVRRELRDDRWCDERNDARDNAPLERRLAVLGDRGGDLRTVNAVRPAWFGDTVLLYVCHLRFLSFQVSVLHPKSLAHRQAEATHDVRSLQMSVAPASRTAKFCHTAPVTSSDNAEVAGVGALGIDGRGRVRVRRS